MTELPEQPERDPDAEPRNRTQRPAAGYTIVMVLISAVILVIMVGLVIESLAIGHRALQEGVRMATAEENVARALAQILPELRQSGTTFSDSDIRVEAEGKQIVFRKNAGFDGTEATWSSEVTIAWNAGALERSVAGEATRTLASGIDSTFTLALGPLGDRVVVTIASTVGPPSSRHTHAQEETVLLRN